MFLPLKGSRMPKTNSAPGKTIIWTAAIVIAALLAGVIWWFGLRKSSPVSKVTPVAAVPTNAVTTEEGIILKENFETLDQGKWPKDWKGWDSGKDARMQVKEESGHHLLEFTTTGGFRMRLSRFVPLSPNYDTYDFSVRARVVNM